jgi:hypothetical protein
MLYAHPGQFIGPSFLGAQEEIEILGVIALPIGVQVGVNGPEYLGAGYFGRVQKKNSFLQFFLLQNEVRLKSGFSAQGGQVEY